MDKQGDNVHWKDKKWPDAEQQASYGYYMVMLHFNLETQKPMKEDSDGTQ